MIHVDEIEQALDTRNLGLLETAFRHLVQWPEEDVVRGADGAAELTLLLDRLTRALAMDRNTMADDLVNCIETHSGDRMWFRDDRSYAAGARAVAARAVKWRLLFESQFGPDAEGQVTVDPYDNA